MKRDIHSITFQRQFACTTTRERGITDTRGSNTTGLQPNSVNKGVPYAFKASLNFLSRSAGMTALSM